MNFANFMKMWFENAAKIETDGGNCFLEYSSHIGILHVRIFVTGWVAGCDPDICLEFENWEHESFSKH